MKEISHVDLYQHLLSVGFKNRVRISSLAKKHAKEFRRFVAQHTVFAIDAQARSAHDGGEKTLFCVTAGSVIGDKMHYTTWIIWCKIEIPLPLYELLTNESKKKVTYYTEAQEDWKNVEDVQKMVMVKNYATCMFHHLFTRGELLSLGEATLSLGEAITYFMPFLFTHLGVERVMDAHPHVWLSENATRFNKTQKAIVAPSLLTLLLDAYLNPPKVK